MSVPGRRAGRIEKLKKRHVIDLLFPIVLFLVLAASSLFLVILAANVYKKSVAWVLQQLPHMNL